MSKLHVDLQALAMAYRKTKADLFYSPRCCREELADYEAGLYENLKLLKKKIEAGDIPTLWDKSEEKGWSLIPKELHPSEKHGAKSGDVIDADPSVKWKAWLSGGSKPKAEFRIMEKLSIEFHVFATYWIDQVGQKLDAKLGKYCYGNRLRREAPEEGAVIGKFNLLSLGSNPKYLKQYRNWQDRGLVAIDQALENNKKVVAITADVSGFYHNLDSSFLNRREFLKGLGVLKETNTASDDYTTLSEDELSLNSLFVQALKAWAKETPLKKGLPVGLTASSLIANLALFEFDQLINKEVCPLYYGRYVDDIILVLENTNNFTRSVDVWEWIQARFDDKLEVKEELPKADNTKTFKVKFEPDYLAGSIVEFKNDKNKVFVLAGVTGKNVLQKLKSAIRERASEWRDFPEMANDVEEIETKIVTSLYETNSESCSLRSADEISLKRSSFAIQLRNIESLSRYLEPNAWRTVRHRFLDAALTHIFVLPTFFNYFNYLTRIIRLSLVCGDYLYVKKITDSLSSILKSIDADCEVSIAAINDEKNTDKSGLRKLFEKEVKLRVRESLICVGLKDLSDKKQMSAIRSVVVNFLGEYRRDKTSEITKAYMIRHENIHRLDLGNLPFKETLMSLGHGKKLGDYLEQEKGVIQSAEIRKLVVKSSDSHEDEDTGRIILNAADSYLESMGLEPRPENYPMGILFPVRPFNVQDLYVTIPRPYESGMSKHIVAILLAHRGFKAHDKLPIYEFLKSEDGEVGEIPDTDKQSLIEYFKSQKAEVGNTNAKVIESVISSLEKQENLGKRLRKLHVQNKTVATKGKVRIAITSWATPESEGPPVKPVASGLGPLKAADIRCFSLG